MSMNKKIDINGTIYVSMDLFEISPARGISIHDAFEKFGVLHHGIKEVVRPSLFKRGYAIITVLVPEGKYVDFYKAHLDKLKPKPSLAETFLLLAQSAVEIEKYMNDIKGLKK